MVGEIIAISTMKTFELKPGLIVDVCEDDAEGCRVVADELVTLLEAGPAVLGLATGATLEGLYAELVRSMRSPWESGRFWRRNAL